MTAVMMEEMGAAPVKAITRTPAANGERPWTTWKRWGIWNTPETHAAPSERALLRKVRHDHEG